MGRINYKSQIFLNRQIFSSHFDFFITFFLFSRSFLFFFCRLTFHLCACAWEKCPCVGATDVPIKQKKGEIKKKRWNYARCAWKTCEIISRSNIIILHIITQTRHRFNLTLSRNFSLTLPRISDISGLIARTAALTVA